MISLYYLITKPTHRLKFLQCSWGAEWLQVTFQLQAALGVESAATKYILGIPHSGIPKVWTASLPALGTVLPAALAASLGGSAPSLHQDVLAQGASLGCPCSQSLCAGGILSSFETCAPELPFPCLGSCHTGPQWAWGMCPPSVTDSSQPNLLERCQWRSSHRLVSQEQKATTRYFYTISIIYPRFCFDLLLSLTVIMSHVAEQ